MSYFRIGWPYIAAVVFFISLSLILAIFRETATVPKWYIALLSDKVDVLIPAFMLTSFLIFLVGSSITLIRLFPKENAINRLVVYKVLNHIIPLIIGFIIVILIKNPPAFIKEFAMGILTGSGLLIALSIGLISKAKFSAKKDTLEEMLAIIYKNYLILSLIVGLITIFFVIFWYAKTTYIFLQLATFGFGVQLSYILIFLFSPRYYLR